MNGVSPPASSIRFRQRRVRRTGWLCVGAAVGLNVALFGTLSVINRGTFEGERRPEWHAIEVVAPPPVLPERIVQPPKKVREETPKRSTEKRAALSPLTRPMATERPSPRVPVPVPPVVRTSMPRVVELPPIQVAVVVPGVAPAPGPTAGPKGPMDIGEVDRIPRAVHTPPTPYPRWARATGKEGTVEVHFVVGTRGRVSNVVVKRIEGDRRFGSLVADAVKRWRFEPGVHGGRPVPVRCQKTMRFRLETRK